MLNPSAERELTENYRLSTEKARQWWNNQAFESRKNIVIESDAVINDDQEVEDQIVADIADSDYDELPDETKQEIDVQIDEEEDIEEIFEVQGEEYLQCSKCDDLFTSNEDYDIHKSVDHGEEPENFKESDETYQLAMNPDLTRESLRKANSLLTETEEKELYGGYDKTGKIQSSVMPYNVPAKATGKYNDNPNEFFYSNKIFRNGSSTERNSALGEAKASEGMSECPQCDGKGSYRFRSYPPETCSWCRGTGKLDEDQMDELQQHDDHWNDIARMDNDTNLTTDSDIERWGESKATEEFDISKYYKEVTEDGWMDYQCNSCGKKIDPDDGYGDQKDYGVLIQELKDHQINHKFVYESKASEDVTFAGRGDIVTYEDLWGMLDFGSRLSIAYGHIMNQTSDDDFAMFIINSEPEQLSDNHRDWIKSAIDNKGGIDQVKQSMGIESKASENNLYRSPDGEFNEQWENAYWDNRLSNAMEDNYGYEQIMEDILRLMDSDSTHSDYYNMRYQQVADAERNRGLNFESKASEDDYEERAEWNWLTNKDSAPEVDYGQVDYEDDGVSDISVPNAEPKDDKNEFLDDVDIKLDEVNFVYPTKSNESTKSYITESEPFDEEYEEFEDSDEKIIEETITVRKLTGYSDNSIAQELHINYGVSHEEALEKVYSVEVSTNDKVAQTFFGKMFKECTESEKDELRMYSGSD